CRSNRGGGRTRRWPRVRLRSSAIEVGGRDRTGHPGHSTRRRGEAQWPRDCGWLGAFRPGLALAMPRPGRARRLPAFRTKDAMNRLARLTTLAALPFSLALPAFGVLEVEARRVTERTGKALGGKADPRYKFRPKAKIRRPLRHAKGDPKNL